MVAARWNAAIVDRLVDGAVDCLRRHDVADDQLQLVRVPGAFEVPLGLRTLAAAGGYSGLVALAVVIRGATPHIDFVCRGCTDGCLRVSLDFGLPVGFGVLTCDTSAQALARAGGVAGNKGYEAALAALEMAGLRSG